MSLEDDRRDPSPSEEPASPPPATPSGAGEEGSAQTSAITEPRTEPAADQVAPYTHADDVYGVYDDPYGYNPYPDPPAEPLAVVKTEEPPPPPPPSAPAEEEADDGDDDGMLRMSFLEHLEELRRRLIYAVGGLGVAFVAS